MVRSGTKLRNYYNFVTTSEIDLTLTEEEMNHITSMPIEKDNTNALLPVEFLPLR
jgi:hypothetical protein